MEHRLFIDIIYILALSALTLLTCSRIRVPTIVGFLLVGVLAGPSGFGLVQSGKEVQTLAELGVVLLMFTIGVEFNLQSLLRIKRLFFLGGTVQAFGTLALGSALAVWAGVPAEKALFIGMLIALSSTAVVLKELQGRGEVDTPHGRTVLGILIYQDLLVVPMMLAVPLFAGSFAFSAAATLFFLAKSVAALGIILGCGKWVVPWLLHQVGKARNQELFLIAIILLCFGISYITYGIGLSLALGAFLAGLMIAESLYAQQALGNVLPLRDIFMSLFFVSVGMLFNIRTVLADPAVVIGGTVALVALKLIIAACAASMVGLPLRSAALTGLTLAQVGEFSFVLAHAGLEAGLFSPQYFQLFLGSSILSMIAAPFLIGLGPAIAEWSMRLPVPRALKVGRLADTPQQRLYDHLIIIGFGLSGRNIAHVADSCRIPYVVIDANPETVRSERALGGMIYHGDATCGPVLEHAGVEAARVAVVAISDMIGTGRVVEMTRALNPAIHIIVRARYLAHAEKLLACGANEVVPEEYETSVEIFTRVLHKYLVPKEEIDALTNQIRACGYRMLRTESTTGASFADLDVILSGMEVRSMRVGNGSSAVGRSLSELNLRKEYGITILSIRRGGETIVLPDGDDCFQAGDDVVLLGLPELLVFAGTIFTPPSRKTNADE